MKKFLVNVLLIILIFSIGGCVGLPRGPAMCSGSKTISGSNPPGEAERNAAIDAEYAECKSEMDRYYKRYVR